MNQGFLTWAGEEAQLDVWLHGLHIVRTDMDATPTVFWSPLRVNVFKDSRLWMTNVIVHGGGFGCVDVWERHQAYFGGVSLLDECSSAYIVLHTPFFVSIIIWQRHTRVISK